jgi:hypothetical protein
VISDVDVGGGLITRPGRVRLQIGFIVPVSLPGGRKDRLSWQLEKEARFHRETIMEWAFGRRFMCGSCGSRDVDYRAEARGVRVRCMRCATDHEVDMNEAVVVPLV